jgi:hypothetical protein
MSKHTPGPWVWRGTPGESVLRSAHGDVFDFDSYEHLWPGIYDPATDAANMRLIAAAPELLAALENARDSIESWGAYASEYFQCKHDLAGELAAIDAAIAKATGEQP